MSVFFDEKEDCMQILLSTNLMTSALFLLVTQAETVCYYLIIGIGCYFFINKGNHKTLLAQSPLIIMNNNLE